MKITQILESTRPIKSAIRNAYIDFSKMTLSLVAVVTDVMRDGKPVIGYGFNSNGRYGQGNLMRERFIPRVHEALPESLISDEGTNLDPHKIWACVMTNERCRNIRRSGTKNRAIRSITNCRRGWVRATRGPSQQAKICSRCRTREISFVTAACAEIATGCSSIAR